MRTEFSLYHTVSPEKQKTLLLRHCSINQRGLPEVLCSSRRPPGFSSWSVIAAKGAVSCGVNICNLLCATIIENRTRVVLMAGSTIEMVTASKKIHNVVKGCAA